LYGPFATGIPGKVRIVYVPQPQAVKMQQLEAGAKYRASVFDPTTGETTDLGVVAAGQQSRPTVSKPERIESDDWVVVLERTE
jgi:hypothetical protein